jgi:hypothetical protein
MFPHYELRLSISISVHVKTLIRHANRSFFAEFLEGHPLLDCFPGGRVISYQSALKNSESSLIANRTDRASRTALRSVAPKSSQRKVLVPRIRALSDPCCITTRLFTV